MKNVIYNKKKLYKSDRNVKLLTVCKSLLNIISVIKPEPIPNGAKLIKAKNLPKMSPKKKRKKNLSRRKWYTMVKMLCFDVKWSITYLLDTRLA